VSIHQHYPTCYLYTLMHLSLSRTHLIKDFELTNIKVVVNFPLDSKDLASSYPPVGMPFYLYGSSQPAEYHIDHTFVAAPNIQLSGGEVTMEVREGTLPTFTDDSPYVKIIATEHQERVMQPFPPNKDIDKHRFFFSPGKILAFEIEGSSPAIRGTLTLTKNSFVDTDMLNEDPVPHTHHDPVPNAPHHDPVPNAPHRGPVPSAPHRGPVLSAPHRGPLSNAPHRVPTPHVPIPHHVPARDHVISPGRGWQDMIVGASPLL
jgi:hypothetical protein